MPNHIYSKVTFRGDQDQIKSLIQAAATLDKKGETVTDFSQVFPCPEELVRVQCGSGATIVSQEAYEKQFKEERHPFFQGTYAITQKMADDYKTRFGYDNWYDWCNANWGTKWGTYQVENLGSDVFRFQTAWSPAHGLWMNISKLFPNVTIATEYADEGGGFVGSTTYRDGEVVDDVEVPWDSEEGLQLRESVGYPNYKEDFEEDGE